MLIKTKFEGYARDGVRLYPLDGGGSAPAQPSSTTNTTTSIPDYAKPYVESMLGKTEALSATPYQTYDRDRIAEFNPLQQQAQTNAANMQTSPQTAAASGMAQQAGLQALNTQYQGGQFQNQFQAPGQYNPAQVDMYTAQAPNLQQYQMDQAQQVQGAQAQGAQTNYNPNLQQYQMGPAEQVRTQSFAAPGSADAYMSPYMQSVVDIQQREAQRTADIAGTQRNAQAVGAGAFGGSRQAIMDAEAARNLATQKGDIQATGSQAAYQQAQQQFNAEQAARLQAQQSNQQAGLTVGGQNLGARLGVQQLGTQTGLQTALANQQTNQAAGMQNAQLSQQAALANQQAGLTTGQANLQAQLGTQQLGSGQSMQAQLANQGTFQSAQQLAEQSRQYGAGYGMSAAQNAAQYGQAANQLQEQSNQYGAGLGLQGLQTALQGAGQLGSLGQQEFQQGMDVNKLQQATGAQQQAQDQSIMSQQYQDFLNQQNYPYKQLGFQSDMLRGLPLSQASQQMYQQPQGALGQVAGAGLVAKGLGVYADGGMVGQRPAGLAELAISKMA